MTPFGRLEAYGNPRWKVDDIILDEVHVGYGWGPPGAPANGCWSRVVDVNIQPGNAIYARAYSVPIFDLGSSRTDLTIRTREGKIVAFEVARVDVPVTYYFDHLHMPVPEPTSPALVVAGFAAWAIRRKRSNTHSSLRRKTTGPAG